MDAITEGRFYERVLGVAALAVLAWMMFRILEPFLTPLAWAAFLGFLLQPLQSRLARLLRGRDSASAALLTVFVLLLFVGPLAAIAVAFARQAGDLAVIVQNWLDLHQGQAMPNVREWPLLGVVVEWLERYTSIGAAQVQSWLVDGGKRVLQQLAAFGGAAVLGALGTIVSFTLMLFLVFFVFRDGRSMVVAALGLVPLPPAKREELRQRMGDVTHAVVRGTLLTSLVQGTLLGIGFAVVGLPAPVVFGVLGAVLSVVPFGGTALVWVPAVGFLLAQGRYGTATVLAVFGVVVSTVDNFLKPLLISGRTVVPTLAVFIGVIGGLSAFGVIGLFLGPVVIALALALAGYARQQATT